MPKLLQINITANWGSHGKIAEGIGLVAMRRHWESYIAYGRWKNPSQSQLYHIGCPADEMIHGVSSRLFDNQGLMSHIATQRLVRYIKAIQPDIIHLHNIHGYYLNYPILFRCLKRTGVPVVWTLHDCWTFTGHCAHYMFAGCERWKTHCQNCPLKSNYPKTLLLDRSYSNFEKKKKFFTSLPNLTLVPVCKWLDGEIAQSFLKNIKRTVIYNGIDTNIFTIKHNNENIRRKYNIPSNNKIVLGVASNWYRKGLGDFIKLRSMLTEDFSIVLVGLNEKELNSLPQNIIGIKRTENVDDLTDLYSTANVFFNATWEDNFPTTNLEALACGTPVITYDTGGSKEAIDNNTGYVVGKGELDLVSKLIRHICSNEKNLFSSACRKRVIDHFKREDRFEEYFSLYEKILSEKAR